MAERVIPGDIEAEAEQVRPGSGLVRRRTPQVAVLERLSVGGEVHNGAGRSLAETELTALQLSRPRLFQVVPNETDRHGLSALVALRAFFEHPPMLAYVPSGDGYRLAGRGHHDALWDMGRDSIDANC